MFAGEDRGRLPPLIVPDRPGISKSAVPTVRVAAVRASLTSVLPARIHPKRLLPACVCRCRPPVPATASGRRSSSAAGPLTPCRSTLLHRWRGSGHRRWVQFFGCRTRTDRRRKKVGLVRVSWVGSDLTREAQPTSQSSPGWIWVSSN